MIYILEIPHQREPSVWAGENEADIVATVQNINAYTGVETNDDFWDCLAVNSRDLSRQVVYMDDAEAIAALNDDKIWRFHQGDKAREMLDYELALQGE